MTSVATPRARPSIARVAGFTLAGLGLAGAAVAAGAASAHHGWGSYDAAKPFTITAPVEHLEWANPHAHMMMKHQGETWEATLAPLSRMQARGLSAEALKQGTPVEVYGYPSTRNAHEMRAERLTVAGKTYELR